MTDNSTWQKKHSNSLSSFHISVTILNLAGFLPAKIKPRIWKQIQKSVIEGNFQTKFFFDFSGVLSGHELLSYSFLGGQACEPRRSVRRKHRYRSSMSLPRSSSRRSSFKFSSLKYMLPGSQKKIKEHDNSDNNSGTPDSELDSGISINGHYDNIDQLQRKNGLRCDYDRIDEIKTMTGTWRTSFFSKKTDLSILKMTGQFVLSFKHIYTIVNNAIRDYFNFDLPVALLVISNWLTTIFRGNDVKPNQ